MNDTCAFWAIPTCRDTALDCKSGTFGFGISFAELLFANPEQRRFHSSGSANPSCDFFAILIKFTLDVSRPSFVLFDRRIFFHQKPAIAMKNAVSINIILLFASTLVGCNKRDEAPVCQAPTSLKVQSPCQNRGLGTVLIPAGQKVSDNAQFSYLVYFLEDTVSTGFNSRTRSWKNFSNGEITIPDTTIADSPKFLVRLTVWCNGELKESPFFGWYVKRPTTLGCYVWVQQEQ